MVRRSATILWGARPASPATLMTLNGTPSGTGTSPRMRATALAVLAMLVLSPDGLLVRLVDAGEWQIVFWRGAFSFLALTLFLTLTRKGGFVGGLRDSGLPGLACSALMAAGSVMFIASLTRTHVANTLLVLSIVPLFAALLGLVFLREAVPRRTWFAIAAAVAGMAIIFGGSLGGSALLGDVLAAGTALCMAGSLVIVRANPRVSMLPALAASGLVAAMIGAALGNPFAVSWSDVGLAATMGIVQQALAIGLFLAAARHLPPAESGLLALIETVLGPLWVWLVVGEIPGSPVLLGGAVVLAALAANFAVGLWRRPLAGR